MKRLGILTPFLTLLLAGCMEPEAVEPSSSIVLNSLGFLPHFEKQATITSMASDFTVRRTIDDGEVYSGTASGPHHQEDVGREVWIADFSLVTESGRYYLDIPGVGRSIEFDVEPQLYNSAYRSAMKAFHLWRCGTAVEGTHDGVTFAHGPCHLEDAWQDYIGEGSTQRDGTGGWHDAGDYGKYTVNAGVTMGVLFLAWDHFQDRIDNVSLGIPETAPGYPEFLQELKWETDWLLKMPYTDGTGRVSHKLTRVNFSGFIMPEKDDEKRYFTEWSSAATADFVATMAMAARYFQPYDPDYSTTCLEAAKKSYAFLLENPEHKPFEQGDFRTGGYQTEDPDDRLWAAAELWESTGEEAYLEDFETRAAENPVVEADWDWDNVANLGFVTYLLSERGGRQQELVETLRKALVATADGIVQAGQEDVYGRPLGGRYYWGCNGTVARQVVLLQVAGRLTSDARYAHTAHSAIAHLFGRNYYGRSFVTGMGLLPPMHPHSRRSGADGVGPPWPGYIVGGGHTATGWEDVEESYSTNEIAINWQAALVYALASTVE